MTHLYRHFDKDDVLLYVGVSKSTFNRLIQHHDNSHWFDRITRVTIEKFTDRKEALQAERIAINKENPLFNLMRPTVKEDKAFIESRAEESRKNLVKRIVQFNAIYSVTDAARVIEVSENKLKEMIRNNEIGHVEREQKPRKNRFGVLVSKPRYLITGWQLIDYLESLLPSEYPAEIEK